MYVVSMHCCEFGTDLCWIGGGFDEETNSAFFCFRPRSPGERSFAGRMIYIFDDSPGECGAKRPKWVASLTSFAGRKIRLAGRIELEVEIFFKLVLIITF